MGLYKIKNWDTIYENNRTRGLKSMAWLPLPVKLNGDGYTLLMEMENGPALFGAFVSVLEVAASCNPRGSLIRANNTPHDPVSLARLTRINQQIITEMLIVCSQECKWLDFIDLSEGATIPHDGAVKSHEGAAAPILSCSVLSSNVMSFPEPVASKKNGKHLFKNSPYYVFENFRSALPEWSESLCRDYWERANDYCEQHNAMYANWIAAVKNWERRDSQKTHRNTSRFGRQEVSMADLKAQMERVILE
jgi:hypothetical protein